MSNNISYEYNKKFNTHAEAMKFASSIHGILTGNKDYVDSNILLNVTDDTVILVEFDESKTHIRVDEEDGKVFVRFE